MDSLAPQTVTKEGIYSGQVENVQNRSLDHRFGVEHGQPQTYTTAGDHDLFVPSSGKQARLRWICIYSDPDNTAKCIVNVKFSAGAEPNMYRAPFPPSPAFAAFTRSAVREGEADAKIQVNLSSDQTVYVNFAAEEF